MVNSISERAEASTQVETDQVGTHCSDTSVQKTTELTLTVSKHNQVCTDRC